MKKIGILIGILLIAAEIFVSFYNPEIQIGVHHINYCPAWVLPVVMGLITLLSAGAQYSTQNKASKEMKQYQNDATKRYNDYKAWFEGEYNEDFLDSDQGRSVLNQLTKNLGNTVQNNQTGAIRTGATVETQIASQGAAQDVFANALSQLTSIGAQQKNQLRNSYDYNVQNYLNPLTQLQAGKINNWNQLGTQIGDSSAGLINAIGTIDWNNMS